MEHVGLFKTTIGIIVGIMLCCSQGWTETRTVTMGVFPWEPFVSDQEDQHGVLADIVIAALERMGYTVIIKSYPFARIMKYLKTGELDLAPAISVNDKRKTFLEFSSPIYELEQGVTFKKGRIPFKTIVDLKPYKGGIMRGTFWVNELKSAGIRFEEITEQEQNIKMLAADRVDFVCMPKEIAFYLIKKLGKDPNQYAFGRLRADGQPVGISQRTKFKELREDINQGLALIKQDGTYDNILNKDH